MHVFQWSESGLLRTLQSLCLSDRCRLITGHTCIRWRKQPTQFGENVHEYQYIIKQLSLVVEGEHYLGVISSDCAL